jgi:5'-3' exonuclease
MGIPSYFVHIVKTYPTIIKEFVPNKIQIDNFYLDSNSIIYDAIKNNAYKKGDAAFESKVIQWICDKLLYYINLINPEKKVLIAFDGVAPLAKLDQQRNRRYNTWFVNNFLEKAENEKKELWDTTAITPGSNFMKTLSNTIKLFFKDKLPKLDIIISSSEHNGEGEHKIYKYIRKHSTYHNATATIIYGLDADLLMLSLIHLKITTNLYLFRETPHFISSVNNRLKPHCLYVLDIFELNEKLHIEMTKSNSNSNSNKNITLDYIFLCFLLGNDFLPHFPALNIRTNGIQIILDVYNSKQISVIEPDETINWRELRKLIEHISLTEVELCKIEATKRDNLEQRLGDLKNKQTEEALINLPILDRAVEKYINIGENGWQKRYYKELFDIEINDLRKQEICLNYLEGLEWTFKYYTEDCPDWKWRYKYKYPPLLEDLYKYIPHFSTRFIDKNTNQPVSQELQLSYVLPVNSLHLLPESISKKLLELTPNNYKSDYTIKHAYCRYLWEGHVDLPELNINELEKIVKN